MAVTPHTFVSHHPVTHHCPYPFPAHQTVINNAPQKVAELVRTCHPHPHPMYHPPPHPTNSRSTHPSFNHPVGMASMQAA